MKTERAPVDTEALFVFLCHYLLSLWVCLAPPQTICFTHTSPCNTLLNEPHTGSPKSLLTTPRSLSPCVEQVRRYWRETSNKMGAISLALAVSSPQGMVKKLTHSDNLFIPLPLPIILSWGLYATSGV